MINSLPTGSYSYLTSKLVVVAVCCCFAFTQGCDSITSDNELTPDSSPREAAQHKKLRHPGLLSAAERTAVGSAGKNGASKTDLFLAFNTYEANGITRRVIDKYDVTKRILEEYGITRRVLDKYGITKRVLDSYGIKRRILNQYGITRRVLDKYGITPRVLSKYDDLVTMDLLATHDVTEATLIEEGLTLSDIEDFNKLSALLNKYGKSVEDYINDRESYQQPIRVKVYVDGAHLGTALSMESKITQAFLDEISDDEDIMFAEPDVTFSTTELGTFTDGGKESQIIPWGITDIVTPLIKDKDEKKASYQDVSVYILDSGAIKKNSKDDLKYKEEKDFTMLFENPDVELWDEDHAPDVSGFDPGKDGNPLDETGHGAHVAGTIGASNNKYGVVGVASGIELYSLKVLDNEGRTDITTLLAAVDYVTRAKKKKPERPVVVNMSLGVDIGTTSYNILDEAIAASIAEGVIYVVAAGNDGRDVSTYSPGHVEGVITVGAYNMDGSVSSFSNYGPLVDVFAPGENIVSLSHIADEMKHGEAILASGTSYAAPHVTGAAARYLGENPTATPDEVAQAIKAAATAKLTDLPGNSANRALNVSNLLSLTPDEEEKEKKPEKEKNPKK